MNSVKKAIELIIKAAITGEKQVMPTDATLEDIYTQLKRHSILTLGYHGLVICGADKKHAVMQQLFKDYIATMMRSERQLAEKDRLLQIFEDNGIDYLPLKGCNMKALYPKPELRVMGDADILIHESDYAKISGLLKNSGFEQTAGADHTLNWKNDSLYLELHRRLVPVDDKDYLAYFGDGWQRAIHQKGHCWEYSTEDEFIFLFTHFARHIRFGGVGYRQFTDIWVYTRHYTDLDYGYINAEMEKLQLREFFENAMKTVSACFEDGDTDEKTDFISEFIFNSGSWGSITSYTISRSVRDKASGESGGRGVKTQTLVRAFFPRLHSMSAHYRILEKHPALLPAMWVVRWCDIAINRPKNVSRRFRQVSAINEDNVAQRKEIMDAVGLTYNFGEKTAE